VKFNKVIGALFFIVVSACFSANSALIKTIDEISNDRLTVSINGSLDRASQSNTINPGYLAYKADSSGNGKLPNYGKE
jgi:hypothetical protein